jgi:DNA-3-methyladenine glycosylase
MPRLPCAFFARPTQNVARELLGQRLVRLERGQRLAGLITETEAYIGQDDLACHARFGRTPRSAVMFGRPGVAYVYFTYGMHWMLNVVTEAEGFPAAVLIRGLRPLEGEARMRRRRGLAGMGSRAARRAPAPLARLTDGPAKLAQALSIDRRLNGHDLCAPGAVLYIERAAPAPDDQVTRGPRIGLNNTPEPWKSMAWNWKLEARD